MISSTMAEMQHRSKHNAEDEIASPRKRVNGNADPHSRIVRNAKLCVLILLFIILPSCKHGSCKECRSLTGQNDRYKYINTKCNYFHQKFCKFRKYFLPGVVAFGDFRKASFLISASYTSSQPLTLQSCFARSFLFPSSTALWISLMLMGMLGAAGTALCRRRKMNR